MSAWATPFAIQHVVSRTQHTLMLRGELDRAAAPEFEDTMVRLCAHTGEKIVLDLSMLTFLDSTGLRAILGAKERCQEHGHELRLIPGPRNVQKVFELTGLLDELRFEGKGRSDATSAKRLRRKSRAKHDEARVLRHIQSLLADRELSARGEG